MLICPFCRENFVTTSSNLFCSKDGTKLISLNCSCGNSLGKFNKFCSLCGNKVDIEALINEQLKRGGGGMALPNQT